MRKSDRLAGNIFCSQTNSRNGTCVRVVRHMGKFRTCIAHAGPHTACVPTTQNCTDAIAVLSVTCATKPAHRQTRMSNRPTILQTNRQRSSSAQRACVGVAELALRTTKSLVQEDNKMSEPEVEQKLRVSKQHVAVVDRSFKRTLEKEVKPSVLLTKTPHPQRSPWMRPQRR